LNSGIIPPRKTRRVPKPGCFFHGLHILGYILLGLGGLTTLGGFVGFVSIFIKTAPGISSALQYLDQKFALFVLTLIATYFGVFAGLGCVGLIVIGLGALFIFISTEPIEKVSIDKPPSAV
jgi:hypothetical protein